MGEGEGGWWGWCDARISKEEGKGRKEKECFARGGFLFLFFISNAWRGEGGGEKGIRKCESILYYKVIKALTKCTKYLPDYGRQKKIGHSKAEEIFFFLFFSKFKSDLAFDLLASCTLFMCNNNYHLKVHNDD